MKITLPKSKHKLGYTRDEIIEIAKINNIDEKLMFENLGVNTGAITEEGVFLTYHCDIENAMHKIFTGKRLFFD